jgi:RNAse (barnase) inhibitor barstar
VLAWAWETRGSTRIEDEVRLKSVYEIDGLAFSTLEEFYEIIARVLIPGADWGRNLSAFNDILRGGFGTPENGFVLRWKNSHVSRERLGYPETIRQLELRLQRCHPLNRISVEQDLDQARGQRGPTVFDWLLEIIQIHCPGGSEGTDGVELILE